VASGHWTEIFVEYRIIVIKFFVYMQRNKVIVLLVTVTYVIESGMVVLLLKVVAFIFSL